MNLLWVFLCLHGINTDVSKCQHINLLEHSILGWIIFDRFWLTETSISWFKIIFTCHMRYQRYLEIDASGIFQYRCTWGTAIIVRNRICQEVLEAHRFRTPMDWHLGRDTRGKGQIFIVKAPLNKQKRKISIHKKVEIAYKLRVLKFFILSFPVYRKICCSGGIQPQRDFRNIGVISYPCRSLGQIVSTAL